MARRLSIKRVKTNETRLRIRKATGDMLIPAFFRQSGQISQVHRFGLPQWLFFVFPFRDLMELYAATALSISL